MLIREEKLWFKLVVSSIQYLSRAFANMTLQCLLGFITRRVICGSRKY